MALSDCEIVPTRDSRIFHFRVRFSSTVDFPAAQLVKATTVVAGCKCLVVCLPRALGTEIAVAMTVLNNPFLEGNAKLSPRMVLLDKAGSPAPSMGTCTTMDLSNPKVMDNVKLTAGRDDVKANCVVDNYFVVACSVDINGAPPTPSLEQEQELPSLGQDLAMMWDKQDLTDVSFNVGGESFSSHRLVLATRSPVFRAELYGPMAESKMSSITIQDMEASTFRSMLHYMYHGSLPSAGKADVSLASYQHLLVAADRYGIEGLKKIVEDELCGNGIMMDSVVSMLELAEDHACPELKSKCFDFLAEGDNFKMVATSGEYLHLMQSFPTLLVEVRNRFKIAHEKTTIMEPGSRKKARVI